MFGIVLLTSVVLVVFFETGDCGAKRGLQNKNLGLLQKHPKIHSGGESSGILHLRFEGLHEESPKVSKIQLQQCMVL